MRKILGFSLLIFTCFITTRLEAPIPPESYSLVELKTDEAPVDKGFEAWENSVNSVVEPSDLKTKEYQKFTATLTETEKVFTDLKRLSLYRKKGRKKFVKDFEKKFADKDYRAKLQDHILYVDVLNEVIETKLASKSFEKTLTAEINKAPGNICPKKEVILRTLESDDRNSMPVAEVKAYLEEIKTYNSKRFRKLALADLMEMTDEEGHGEIKDLLAEAISCLLYTSPSPRD